MSYEILLTGIVAALVGALVAWFGTLSTQKKLFNRDAKLIREKRAIEMLVSLQKCRRIILDCAEKIYFSFLENKESRATDMHTQSPNPSDLQHDERLQEIRKEEYNEAREIVREMEEKITFAKSELDGIFAIAHLFFDEKFLVLFEQMVSKLDDVASEMRNGRFEIKNSKFIMQKLEHTPSWEDFSALYDKTVVQLRAFCENG